MKSIESDLFDTGVAVCVTVSLLGEIGVDVELSLSQAVRVVSVIIKANNWRERVASRGTILFTVASLFVNHFLYCYEYEYIAMSMSADFILMRNKNRVQRHNMLCFRR